MADITRILEALIDPIGIIWLANLVAAVALTVKRKWRGAVFCGAVVLTLFIFGSTSLPNYLLVTLERPYARRTLADVPSSDAVVMLGGVASPSEHDPFGFQFRDGADRAVTALELMRQRKAAVLVLGGGGGRTWSESQLLTNWSSVWNLPTGKITILPVCKNTREEAEWIHSFAREQGWQRIILVTSAYHMRRSEAIFRKLNILATPVACDFVGMSHFEGHEPFNPVPRPERLGDAWLYFHECVGWWYYRLRGWVTTE